MLHSPVASAVSVVECFSLEVRKVVSVCRSTECVFGSCCGSCVCAYCVLRQVLYVQEASVWSSGMILPLGGRGPEFKSRYGPFFCRHSLWKWWQNDSFTHKSFTSIRLSSLFWRHQDCWNLKETAIVSISIPAIVKYICVSLKICLWQKNFKTIVFQTQIQINFIGTCRATAHYFILDTVSTCTFKILSSITTWSLSDNYDKSSQGVYTGFWPSRISNRNFKFGWLIHSFIRLFIQFNHFVDGWLMRSTLRIEPHDKTRLWINFVIVVAVLLFSTTLFIMS